MKSSDLRDLGQPKSNPAEGANEAGKRQGLRTTSRWGRFYFKDGNYTGATARYKDALERDPENPDAHFGLAEVLIKQNKRADAAAELQKVSCAGAG